MKDMNEERKASFLAKISGGNRNVERQLYMYSDPGFREQIEKDREYWRQAHPVDQAYAEAMGRNPKFARESMGAQAEGAQQAIGEPLAKAAIPYMDTLRDLFRTIGDTASKNPGWVVEATKMFGALELLGTVPFVAISMGIGRIGKALRGLIPGYEPKPTGPSGTDNLLRPQNYNAPDGGAVRPSPINFVQPPPREKTENHYHNTALNIDGQMLASVVEQHIAQMHELPDSASSSNGIAYPTLNDWNPINN
jgi:hypothetical protein